jgi:uncharacterized Tic20 family protein
VRPEDKSLAMLCHLLGIFTGFIGPLIVWMVKKDQSAFIAHHGRESLNFQITVMLIMFCLTSATFILMFVVVGIALVAEIMAAVAAQNGECYRYPWCIRMV